MTVNRGNVLLLSIKTSSNVNALVEILEELCFPVTPRIPLITLTCHVWHRITRKMVEGLVALQTFNCGNS